jgi:Tfp pilus assembly protein PilO
MNTINRDLLNRPRVWVSLALVTVLALGWWFGWMSPEATKLASVRARQVGQRATVASLASQLAKLRADAKRVQAASPFLQRFGAAIPAQPDSPGIVEQVYHLSVRDRVSLSSITDDVLSAASGSYSTIPVSMTVSGGHDAVLSFVAGLYKLPRLLTIQSLNLTGITSVLATGNSTYSATISATAYTTYVAPAHGSTAAVPATTS